MNFHFNKIILWLNSSEKRELTFHPNKVNVITGGSNTGKTAILQIIDYCLFANHSKLPESIINENVAWYGINVQINKKNYTICRTALSQGKVTHNYFFSSSGEIPEFPKTNNEESTIKALIETEFSIDRKIAIPFGGKMLKAGSKISLRYFLMFTTISQDIIANSSVYFDKQDESRYREALPRIFDLAVGIDTIENILAREKKLNIESEILKLERKQAKIDFKKDDFKKELVDVVKRAKELGLVEPDTIISEAISNLREPVDTLIDKTADNASNKYNKLKGEYYRRKRVIRNLKQLKNEYASYKVALKDLQDSLKPIEYLKNKNSELIKTSIYYEVISALEADFASIKLDIRNRTPIDMNIFDLINEHEKAIQVIQNELNEIPQIQKSFKNDKEKYLFLGETKAKLDIYKASDKHTPDEIQSQLDDLQSRLDSLHVMDSTQNKVMFVKLIEEIIQFYIEFVGDVLENYQKYHPVFDYTQKALLLRKPLTDFIENIGSSSNHMFIHLFLFLGLHEAMKRKKAPFVPSYLILDQPSRPYWGEGEKKKEKLDRGDEKKIRKAFELLNDFMERIHTELETEFQMIVFEHVPPSTWEGLNHINLVEEFVGENALIPEKMLNR